MAQIRTRYEQRSILDALETYLSAAGFSDITYTDGYQPETPITPPQVTVTLPPSSPVELQLGRVRGQESLYARSVVVNAYMETEGRASAVIDAVMDFFEFECVVIKDHLDAELGTIQCNRVRNIVGEVFPPMMMNPQNLRWRGAVTAPMESYYPNS
jgi:hypothetical protein